MGNMPLRLVVLDNNGTCLDDLHIAYGSACATLQRWGVTAMPTLQQYRDQMNSNWKEWYYRYGMPANVTRDEMNAVRKEYYAQHGHAARHRPDLRDFLGWCKDRELKVAMVSAEVGSILQDSLAGADLRRYFDHIEAEAWPKVPALAHTLAELMVPPGEAVYVDDSEEGLAGAKSLGMRTIGFTNPTAYASEERILAAQPDACAADFTEVREIVRGWL